MKITAQKVTFIMHSNMNCRMLYSNDSRIIMTLDVNSSGSGDGQHLAKLWTQV